MKIFLVLCVTLLGLGGCMGWDWPWSSPKSPVETPDDHNTYTPTTEDTSALEKFIELTMDENDNGYHKATRDPTYGLSNRPEDVRFYIYNNPNNSNEFHEIKYGHEREVRQLVLDGIIHPKAHWKFLIHGFLQDQNTTFPQLAVTEYLTLWKNWKVPEPEMNIIVVDWGRLAANSNATHFTDIKGLTSYPTSVENVKIAGKRVGDMIQFLKRLHIKPATTESDEKEHRRFETALMHLKKVHIIGFSLGAHVAGKAGSTVSKRLGRTVGRVTGLDPAGPGFWKDLDKEGGRMLRKGDSGSLDIIHTNAGGFGINQDLGDVDFYVNANYFDNGWILGSMSQVQPFCTKKYGKIHITKTKPCSHSMAPVYFSLSINHPDLMYACKECKPTLLGGNCKCKISEITMGEWWDPDLGALGNYYLTVDTKKAEDTFGPIPVFGPATAI